MEEIHGGMQCWTNNVRYEHCTRCTQLRVERAEVRAEEHTSSSYSALTPIQPRPHIWVVLQQIDPSISQSVFRITENVVLPQIDPSISQSVFRITEKAPTRAFSWLKAPTSTCIDPTVSRCEIGTPMQLLQGWATIRHYGNQPAHFLWLLCHRPNFTSTYRGGNTHLA